jgi:hypothetical protein
MRSASVNWSAAFSRISSDAFLCTSGAPASDGIVAANPHFGNGAAGTRFRALAMTESTMIRLCAALFFERCAV